MSKCSFSTGFNIKWYDALIAVGSQTRSYFEVETNLYYIIVQYCKNGLLATKGLCKRILSFEYVILILH